MFSLILIAASKDFFLVLGFSPKSLFESLEILFGVLILVYSCFLQRYKLFAGGDPDQLCGALPLHVPTGGVSLDDDENQTHGWTVGQRHPLSGRQAEPDQAAKEEGELTGMAHLTKS